MQRRFRLFARFRRCCFWQQCFFHSWTFSCLWDRLAFLSCLSSFVNRVTWCWSGWFLIDRLLSVCARLFCALVYLAVYPQLHSGDRLFQLFVVTDRAFGVDDHSCGHQPSARTYSNVQSYLGLINRQLVPLHAMMGCLMGCLMASSISIGNSLWASFARLLWSRILLRTLTCAQKMQYTKASIDWLIREWPACVKPEAVFGDVYILLLISSANVLLLETRKADLALNLSRRIRSLTWVVRFWNVQRLPVIMYCLPFFFQN